MDSFSCAVQPRCRALRPELNLKVVRRLALTECIALMPVDLRHIFKRVVYIELERLDGFWQQSNTQYSEEIDHLRELGGDEDEGLEFYADEAYVLDSIRTLVAELRVIGLYRVVELNAAKMIDSRFGSGVAQREQTHKFHRLRHFLRSEVGTDIAQLPDYPAVDELRCLNNAVKHAGVVSAELAKYSNWRKGEELDNLDSVLSRLQPSVPIFLAALADAVLPSP